MIITYPLNEIEYTAADAETYLSTRTSGVYSSEGHFALSVTGDRQITISPGLAWINNGSFKGKSVASTEAEVLDITAPGALPRKDLIVLRFDATQNGSSILVKKGEEASLPSLPTVERTAGVYELGLYAVDVKVGSAAIYTADVQSLLLDESYCGVMRDGVTGIPTAQIQAQATAIMNSLISHLSDQLTNITSATVTRGDGVGDPTCTVEFTDDASRIIFHFDNVNGQSVTHTFKDNILTFESASGKTTIDLTAEALGVYKKEQVVSKETKISYGLDDTAVPDDVFAKIEKHIAKTRSDISSLFSFAAKSARVSFGTISSGTTGQVVISPGFKPMLVMCGTPDEGNEFMIAWYACSSMSKFRVTSSGVAVSASGFGLTWSNDSVSLGIGAQENPMPYIVIGIESEERA